MSDGHPYSRARDSLRRAVSWAISLIEADSCGAGSSGGKGFEKGNKCAKKRRGNPQEQFTLNLSATVPKELFVPAMSKPIHRNAQDTQEELYEAAKKNMDGSADSFPEVLKASLEQKLDFEELTFGQALDKSGKNSPLPFLLVAPLKGMERASEKVAAKYKGDWARLTDVVRGTVSVPKARQVRTVVSALRSGLRAHGWSIEPKSLEDKYASPTPAGYRDVAMLLRAPNGQLCELQVNTHSMWYAKESKGHKMYEEYRRLSESSVELSAEQKARKLSLEDGMKDLYRSAYELMTKGS